MYNYAITHSIIINSKQEKKKTNLVKTNLQKKQIFGSIYDYVNIKDNTNSKRDTQWSQF